MREYFMAGIIVGMVAIIFIDVMTAITTPRTHKGDKIHATFAERWAPAVGLPQAVLLPRPAIRVNYTGPHCIYGVCREV